MKKKKYLPIVLSVVFAGFILFPSCSKDEKLTKPNASFTVDKNTVTSGEVVTFTITGSGDMFTIWTGESKDKYGHPVDMNTLIFKYKYTEEGSHTAKCIAVNVSGTKTMYDSTTVEIVVNPSPGK